ncbi:MULTISPECIES: hemerythrin domain-containing protein [unclassified Streptomyces]|uniref:hemerythrin domain-containing protein n=1 Tax=unclassified Streptomyces TaxID=2593676 RepID=UPI001661769B|nr:MULTISPECIES: hemerythrin domain-containing protein [unclassified Streptomyces]MBD0710827.1 hemerythrin [Streptomyces sp. CBMA291]MBD0717759.1 hemerythrin [Streptomyces sp. CBMA370]
MCHYCGCREIPLIKEFIAEHETVTDLAGDAVRALRAGDRDRARTLAARMTVELRSHWAGEERGLFAVMGENEEYTAYVDALVREHRELAAFLDALDLDQETQRDAFVRAVDELHEHIAKEEDGLFPASLTELTGDQWDRSFAAWRSVHSGREPR